MKQLNRYNHEPTTNIFTILNQEHARRHTLIQHLHHCFVYLYGLQKNLLRGHKFIMLKSIQKNE